MRLSKIRFGIALILPILISCEGKNPSQEPSIDQESSMIDCPLCRATGIWVNNMTGIRQQCSLCEGTGKTSGEQAEKIADFFNEIGGSGTYGTDNAECVQSQIDMYNTQISQLQQMLDNMTSETYRAYYSQEIIQLQYKVKELELLLKNMK